MNCSPVQIRRVPSVNELQHLSHDVWMKILYINLLAFFLCHVILEHGTEYRGPCREHELMTVEGLVSTLDLDVTELLVLERILQVHAELLVPTVLGLQGLGTLLRILGARQSPLSADDGDIAHDGQAVIGQPLGGRGPALQDVGVNELPEAPGVWFSFELCESGLDSVLLVLGRVQDRELVPCLHLGLSLVTEVHGEVTLSLGGVALGEKTLVEDRK